MNINIIYNYFIVFIQTNYCVSLQNRMKIAIILAGCVLVWMVSARKVSVRIKLQAENEYMNM